MSLGAELSVRESWDRRNAGTGLCLPARSGLGESVEQCATGLGDGVEEFTGYRTRMVSSLNCVRSDSVSPIRGGGSWKLRC